MPPTQNCLVRGLPRRAATTGSTRWCPRTARTSPPTAQAARTGQDPGAQCVGQDRLDAAPGCRRHRAGLGERRDLDRRRRLERRCHAGLRRALRQRPRRRRQRTWRSCRPSTTSRSNFATSPRRTTGSTARSARMTTGWLGRWLDPNGSATNPLQAVSLDSALEGDPHGRSTRCARSRSLATLGYSMHALGGYGTARSAARPTARPTPTIKSSRPVAGPATRTCPGAQLVHAGRRRYRPPATRSPARRSARERPTRRHRRRRTTSATSSSSPRCCWARTWERGSSRSTGARSTPTATSSAARIRS